MFLEFDQRIEPPRVLEHLNLQPANSETVCGLATQEEIAADEEISELRQKRDGGSLAGLASGRC